MIIDAWPNIEKVLDRVLLYHHTKVCAANGTIGRITSFASSVSLEKLTLFLDNKPLFHVPKSIALNSIKDWKNDLAIQFPVSLDREKERELMLI
jgi:inositol-1,3,4-trisphosphate 5/6-kinase/inositol-tetrakisphosphate 1-kinase